ncbi:MAG TPA: hypothetical protein PK095_00125 [Myxococcota bacterium]|nr:hypothetical protein [Myxococcota bacterium]
MATAFDEAAREEFLLSIASGLTRSQAVAVLGLDASVVDAWIAQGSRQDYLRDAAFEERQFVLRLLKAEADAALAEERKHPDVEWVAADQLRHSSTVVSKK